MMETMASGVAIDIRMKAWGRITARGQYPIAMSYWDERCSQDERKHT